MAFADEAKMTGENRRKVLWFGPQPDNSYQLEFKQRQLDVEFTDVDIWKKSLYETRGVVIKFNNKKKSQFINCLKEIYPLAADYGIMIYGIIDDDDALFLIEHALKGLQIDMTNIPLRVLPPSHEVAEKMARYNPGPAPKPTLEIISEVSDLGNSSSEIIRLFFRRAFFDCKSIFIKPLPGGRTNAQIFSVNAIFEDSIVGPRPLPFFAKIDDKHRIKREIENYQIYTSHFIQFNLRPNIESERCLLGFDKGILVGNFVEQSELLWDVARRGTAQSAIYSLFDNALRGWRLQAKKINHIFVENMSAKVNGDFFDPDRVPHDRLEIAYEKGATHNPKSLKQILFNVPQFEYFSAPMHGDLHASNIRVRGNDAILIDFASTREGPLVADPASLEVSLAFEVNGDEDDNESWELLINTLYEPNFMDKPPSPAREPRPREWLWSCIRQIRLMALAEVLSQEYKLAVAIYLLRRSMYPSLNSSDNYRKAYAYLVAERIILDAKSKIEKIQ